MNSLASNAFCPCIRLAVIVVGLLMPLHAFADTLNPIPSVKDIRRFAEDVVISSKPGTRLVKWTHAPTVRLETKVAGPRDASTGRAVPVPAQTHEIYYAALRSHIQDLAELTGMPIRLMPRDIGVGGDIVITIVPRMQMSGLSFPGVSKQTLSQIMGPSRCFFIIWPTREWAVSKARIVINSILDDDHIKHCLLEELTQSLGLPNDSDRLRPSIFNETAMLQKLSDLDRILIRTVYDPRINPGMDLGAFRDKAETVIGSYMAVPE